MLVGGAVTIIGVLVALGSILVLQRAGGDLLADVGFRRGTDAPAWLVVGLLCAIGTAIAAAGVGVAVIGWRAAARRIRAD